MQKILSFTTIVLFLSSFTAAENINDLSSPPLSIATEPYTITLTCAECAFSYSDCLENVQPPAFLSITFSTQNDTLLANNAVIFPPSWPLQFAAQRQRASLTDTVPLAYALDVQPLPHQPGAILGDLYHLTLTLVDLQGRRATEHPVSVGVVRDTRGGLSIIQVEEAWRRYHRKLKLKGEGKELKAQEGSEGPKAGWWNLEAWRPHAASDGPEHQLEPETQCSGDWTAPHPCTAAEVHGYPGHGKHHGEHHRQRLDDWIYDRHFHSKFAGPAVISGLLGVMAAFFAGALGFFVGKLIVAIYCYFFDGKKSQTTAGAIDEERYLEEVVGLDEERLMGMEKKGYAFGHRVVNVH
ncbi:uncharacterized protein DSM5745_09433 [Aspergillus mulundensis]|uniref:Uncharacterized protein n=1 Tax=Aspergillus mulundensis TaxID=1810919 RepID=A0A3D8QW03_9EURO|nr:Uncharacterized protein DSM5745_09433 [Aspergillus mulundensis]RDW65694.1 Uncharacterized protein DSM5745_09433 [Aspergillus mulundensis]